MFSGKIKARLAGLAMIGAAFAIPGAANAGVVVKSSGPSSGQYPVGRQVSDTATISLRSGDKVTVLTDNGTSVLQGPGDFVVGQGATRTRSRFSTLSRRESSSRARTGAVRGAGTETTAPSEGPRPAPSLWFVDLASSGNICLYDYDRVRLWRPIANGPQNYTITDQTSQASLEVTFVETETMRAWDPAALPLEPGRNYTITGPAAAAGSGSATMSNVISFVTLSEDYSQQDALAQALISNGCNFQLAQLANELEATAEQSAK